MQGAPGSLWQALLVLSLAAGCATGPVETASSTMPPRAEADRPVPESRAAAVAGLSVRNGLIVVVKPQRADRAEAVRLCRLAESELLSKNLRVKAAGLFRDAVLSDLTCAEAYEGLARCLLPFRDDAVVSAALRTALSLDADRHRARFLLGALHQMRRDSAAATETWTGLIAREPDYPEVYVRLAVLAHYEGDAHSARRWIAEAERRGQPVPPQLLEMVRHGSRP